MLKLYRKTSVLNYTALLMNEISEQDILTFVDTKNLILGVFMYEIDRWIRRTHVVEIYKADVKPQNFYRCPSWFSAKGGFMVDLWTRWNIKVALGCSHFGRIFDEAKSLKWPFFAQILIIKHRNAELRMEPCW